jgi:lipoate---protein ligase
MGLKGALTSVLLASAPGLCKSMYLLDLTLPDPAQNLALDEALLVQAEAGELADGLRFWEAPRPVVILGSGCGLGQDVDEQACREGGVPILRRSSGGGTVLLGPGCLCFTLVLAYERASALRGVRTSCALILDRVRLALAGLASDIELAGTSDLAIAGKKFSGNAQQRKRRYLLHHGTILYDFDLKTVEGYLRMPARRPEYRQDRPHTEFLTNLTADGADLKNRLGRVWQVQGPIFNWPRERVDDLVAEKYSRPEWTRRFE